MEERIVEGSVLIFRQDPSPFVKGGLERQRNREAKQDKSMEMCAQRLSSRCAL